MYNDKIIKIGKKPFELTSVEYTGGGIYVYTGKFEDGTWFTYSDTEPVATIVDADPLQEDPEFINVGADPDWLETHFVASTDTYFPIRILKACGRHLSTYEIDARIDEQREEIEYWKINDKLKKLIHKTAKSIRSARHIPGWHVDDTEFPSCNYHDVYNLVWEAYKMGKATKS